MKEWKAQGCPAFRYGRIYHAELLEWIDAKRRRRLAEHPLDASDEIVTVEDWEHRRCVLFEVLEFLHDAYRDGRINLAKYAELGDSTVELLIKMGEVWDAGIDANGYRTTWLGCLAEAMRSSVQKGTG